MKGQLEVQNPRRDEPVQERKSRTVSALKREGVFVNTQTKMD